MPVRYLIGPGLLLIGVGLLLMLGLGAGSHWTHLIAGLAVAGAGVGMVNPPLASTAVGVVTPERAGMASGINSTFRQVGIATGIALLGTLFSNKVANDVISGSRHVPALAGHGQQLATAVQGGDSQHAVASVPAGSRPLVQQLIRGAFTAGLDRILLVAAIIALVACVVAFATLRSRGLRGPPLTPASRCSTAMPAD